MRTRHFLFFRLGIDARIRALVFSIVFTSLFSFFVPTGTEELLTDSSSLSESGFRKNLGPEKEEACFTQMTAAAAAAARQPQPPLSLQRLLEQMEAANGGAPDAEARQALATLSRIMAESERAVNGNRGGTTAVTEAAAAETTTTEVAAAAAQAAEAQAAATAAAAEALAARVSALESRIEGLAPETTAIVAEVLAETMKEGEEGNL